MYIGRNEALDLTDQGYGILRAIGNGQFGRTYLVRRLDNGELRAAKQVDLANLETEDAVAAGREPQFLALFGQCPYIVKLYEHFVKDHNLNIVMEYCQGGDMARCLAGMRRTGQRFTEGEVIVMLRQILEALAFLHDSFVMHRDLKPSNILIAGDGSLKLADFGVSRQLDATLCRARTAVGTPQYMPPEIIMSRPYSFPGDMWSLGCVLYEMLTLRPAFQGVNLTVAMQICCHNPQTAIGPEWSDRLKDIVVRLLAKEPTKRPQARDLLQSPYLNAMVDPLGQVLPWETPERTLDRVEERDEDTTSHGASPSAGTSNPSLMVEPPPPAQQPLVERVTRKTIEECEVLIWRFSKAITRSKVVWSRAMLENEPTLWQSLTERLQGLGLQGEGNVPITDCFLRDMIVGLLEEEGDQWTQSAESTVNEDLWKAEVTVRWLVTVSVAYEAGLSEIECQKVLSTIAEVSGEKKTTLRSFKRFCSARGKLTFDYRVASQPPQDEQRVLNEVETSIESMYRRICERVYHSGIANDSMEEDFSSHIPNTDGGVPEDLVKTILESQGGMGMSESEANDFLLLAYKTQDGYIRWRMTIAEMLNHTRLPATVARDQDRIPQISDRMALIQSNTPMVTTGATTTTDVATATPPATAAEILPVVEPPPPPPPPPTTSQHDVSAASSSSSRHSERPHNSTSIVHSELLLRSEGQSESGGGGAAIRRSCGDSADFLSEGGAMSALCEHCLSRPAKKASEVSYRSRELSPISLLGGRPRQNSIFSDRGSVYSDANPELEHFSPTERPDVIGLQRIHTLPVEHHPWQERTAYGPLYSSQPRPSHNAAARARKAHTATGPLHGSTSHLRTAGRKSRRPPLERPDIGVRSSREKPGLRSIPHTELSHIPTYHPDRDRDRGTHLHVIFGSSYHHDKSWPTSETIYRTMAEATRHHEHVVEILLVVHSEPYVTEGRLRESLRGLIRDLEQIGDDQRQMLRKLTSSPIGVPEKFCEIQRDFYKIYHEALRAQLGVRCELERLVSKSESGDTWSSALHSRSNGKRHHHPLLSPVSSTTSNIDRLGASLFDASEALIICGANTLAQFTKPMVKDMMKLRKDSQGTNICQNLVSLVQLRNTQLHKVMNPPVFGGDFGSSESDLYEDMDFGSMLELCGQIRRTCTSLEKRAQSDEGIMANRRKGPLPLGAPLSTGMIEERLPRHQSQISPRQMGDSRRQEFLNRETLQRCTTDYVTNYRHPRGDRHLSRLRSGCVSFFPEDGPSYMRRRYTSGSDSVMRGMDDVYKGKGIDEWNDEDFRYDYFR